MSAILGSVDIELGDIDYYDATDTVTNDPALSQVGQVLAIGGMATEVRATVIVTRSLEGGQLLGFSAALGGPKDIGKQSTGVLAVVANQTTDTLGATIVHELAHYLGIWHTTEGDGSFDRIEDTLECPVFGTSTACPTAGGGQLMHFQVLGGTTITPTQGLIMRSHPLVEPAAPGLAKPRVTLPPLSPAALARLRSFYADGCGTCRERAHR